MIKQKNMMKNFSIVMLSLLTVSHGVLSFAGNHEIKKADVTMHSRSGSEVRGNITFMDTDKGVRLKGVVTGLKPNSKHGFHIHEKGDCSAKDASSAGGHFNPKNVSHGSPKEKSHHRGDLGNITTDKNGIARIEMSVEHLSLLPREKKASILKKAVIIHAKSDDLKSQPSGAAGKRVACGVIGS